MAKIIYSLPFDLQRDFWIGDWTAASISEVSTSNITLTLGSETIRLAGQFTVSGTTPTAGTITGFTYGSSGITALNVTDLSLSYAGFQQAVQNGDLNAVLGNDTNWIIGSASADKLYGFMGNDSMEGGTLNDTLVGSYGDDTLDGGSGSDYLQGGSGNDAYVIDNAGDKVIEGLNAGTDTVITSLAAYALGANVENLTYSQGTDLFVGTGNALNNLIVGNRLADKLYGLDGNDTLRGGNGNDSLDGGNGNDFLVGDAGASAVTTSASGVSPSNPSLPISLSMTMPEVAAAGTTSTTVTGYINNATLGSAKFNLAFVLDVSGSMASSFSGSAIGDVNRNGTGNEKVDAAIASFQSLVNSLKSAGLADAVRISLIPFSDSADIQAIGTASSDSNANGVADVIDAALALRDLGGTNYGAGLNKAIEFFNSSPKGDNFVFFISDGQPGDTYSSQLNTLRDKAGINATIRSLGIESGSGGYYDTLDLLDDGLANKSAIDVKSPAGLTSGLLSSQVNTADIKQLEIYKNGILVSTLAPAQLTQTPFGLKYSATIADLSSTGSDTIQTRLVLKDASSSFISTSQQISVGTLASNDSLVGGAGNDTLDGGAGNDTLSGGTGNDLYHIETTGKTIVEAYGAGIDTIETTLSYSLNNTAHQYIENLTLLGSTHLNATGNANSNRLEGNIGNNILNGRGGSDTLVGGYGNDIASYANSGSAIVANLGTGLVTATGKADQLNSIEGIYGSAYNDSITGNNLDNSFRGNAGNDTLAGGAGFDTVDYSRASAAITVQLHQSYSGGMASSADGAEGIDSLANDIEAVVGSGFADVISDATYSSYSFFNDRFDGGAGADVLNGGGGNDTLIGGAGNDTLNGGLGDFDAADYSRSSAAISGSLATGIMTVKLATPEIDMLTGIEVVIGTNYADSIAGGATNDSLAGGGSNDTLDGGAGNDTLAGGTGLDSLIGGAGDDVFYIDSVNDVIVETAGGGTDTAYIDIASGTGSKMLGEVENAYLTGGASLNITGGMGSNAIYGGTGADTLNGGTNVGADTLDGGAGIDWLSYAGHVSGVSGTLNATYSGLIDGDVTRNFENVIGSSFGDAITGDGYNNVIDGGAGSGNDNLYGGYGDDTLKGGGGVDLLDGGYGYDTVSYAHLASATTSIVADLSTGVVTNAEGNDTLISIEHVIGSAGNDSIRWAGTTVSYTDFLLDGGAGNDSLQGSLGDDTLIGGAGNDVLDGGPSNSTYYYARDRDIANYSASTSAVTVNLVTGLATGTATGTDTLLNIEGAIGTRYADLLTGSSAQADYFVGGAGADTLDGGIDAYQDVFAYTDVSDSRGSTFDTIRNFVSSGYYADKLDLAAIDGNTTDGYDSSSFSFIGTAGFSGAAGELRYAKTGTDTFIYADVNGDKVADMTLKLVGLHDLTSSHFYL